MISLYEVTRDVDLFKKSIKNYKRWELNSLLMRSVGVGSLPLIRCLVESGANILIYSNAMLNLAIYHNHLEVVKYLVEMGVDFKANDNDAFKWAIHNGRLEVVKYLVEKGINVYKDKIEMHKLILQTHIRGHEELADYLEGL